jgi:hypothetical protein
MYLGPILVCALLDGATKVVRQVITQKVTDKSVCESFNMA